MPTIADDDSAALPSEAPSVAVVCGLLVALAVRYSVDVDELEDAWVGAVETQGFAVEGRCAGCVGVNPDWHMQAKDHAGPSTSVRL